MSSQAQLWLSLGIYGKIACIKRTLKRLAGIHRADHHFAHWFSNSQPCSLRLSSTKALGLDPQSYTRRADP